MKKIFNKSKIRVSRTAVIIWRIDLTLLMLPVALLIMLIGVFFPVIAAIIGIAAAAAYILAIIFYIPLYCRNLNYTFDKKIITVKKGVLYKRTSVLPVSSVQYCVVMQGLLQKRFRRCSVFLMLAGSFIIISQLKLLDGEALVSALREMQSGGDENGK